MKETTTVVNWPSRLKIGAKTKKDPHVRIVGRLENVLKAKERIMASLDSRVSFLSNKNINFENNFVFKIK